MILELLERGEDDGLLVELEPGAGADVGFVGEFPGGETVAVAEGQVRVDGGRDVEAGLIVAEAARAGAAEDVRGVVVGERADVFPLREADVAARVLDLDPAMLAGGDLPALGGPAI